jgi:hypothetical protein
VHAAGRDDLVAALQAGGVGRAGRNVENRHDRLQWRGAAVVQDPSQASVVVGDARRRPGSAGARRYCRGESEGGAHTDDCSAGHRDRAPGLAGDRGYPWVVPTGALEPTGERTHRAPGSRGSTGARGASGADVAVSDAPGAGCRSRPGAGRRRADRRA